MLRTKLSSYASDLNPQATHSRQTTPPSPVRDGLIGLGMGLEDLEGVTEEGATQMAVAEDQQRRLQMMGSSNPQLHQALARLSSQHQ